MEEEIKPVIPEVQELIRPRPSLLTLLCLVAFVYFGLISILLLTGLFKSGWITAVTNQYMASGKYSNTQVLLVLGAGFLLHALAFTGILLIWKLRKTGYYLLGLSCLIVAAFQLLIPVAAITSTAIYIFLLFLFGIFFNRLR